MKKKFWEARNLEEPIIQLNCFIKEYQLVKFYVQNCIMFLESLQTYFFDFSFYGPHQQ